MNEREELQEFSLDDILNEFHQDPDDLPEEPFGEEPEETPQSLPPEEIPAEAEAAVPEPEEAPAEKEPPFHDTVRLEKLSDVAAQPRKEAPAPKPSPVIIELDPKARLRELKKKLIAGPEKKYYELSELGLGKLQTSVFMNLLLALVCAGMTVLFAMDIVPESRLRLVIFSQVLAMLLSATLGSGQLLDGLSDALRLRFSVNSLLVLTFVSCCVDAVFCLQELRIPCCAAFSFEMAMSMMNAYHRRSTQMAQMDTLRKAVRLHGIVKMPGYFEKRAGFLRTYGNVDHFMDNYDKPTAPEKFQGVYAFLSLLACIGIAAFAYTRHGLSLAVQILSTSLLVAVPASYFIALSRPASILQKRLHMVGTVLCGWQGVKGLKGKAAFPIQDEDLFPVGSTKLNGVKFYGDRDPDTVISYTASLICAAGGGLENVFRQLLNSRGSKELAVRNLQVYGSGGLGGEVAGESVLLGNLSFLQDMGVDIPEGTMVNQAVYASIDGELCAVVAISYAKMRSAAAGIVSLSGSRRLTPVIIGTDFMLTESLIRSKFGVNTRRIAFPGQDVKEQLKQVQADPNATALALTTREDLISYAYAISGARCLRTACTLGTIIHVLGGLLGMLIMLALAYLGSVELLTPTNVLLYQLVWLLPGLLITEWTRTV